MDYGICLVAVVSGELYEGYAKQLFNSARRHVQLPVTTVLLEGRPGWPAATLYRYHAILNWHCQCDYIFLCDADMIFEAPVGEEILGELVATQHPGYVNGKNLPYENRPASAAYMPTGDVYYAGGFVGGKRAQFLALAAQIVHQINEDDKRGIVARWHDESHLNKAFSITPPTVTLSPAYCHPDDDAAYLKVWPEVYERKLVAIDKTPAQRSGR